MRIFLSWSGDRSKTAARALQSLIQDVLGDSVSVFISAHMDPGVTWIDQLRTELDLCDFGILCLTQSNVQSSWLLFEAGAISKKFGASRVVPYLIDNIELQSPLSQFQHVRADREDTLRLLECINQVEEKKPVDRLRRAFDKWWPDLEKTLDSLPPELYTSKRSDRELLETISQGVQALMNMGADSRGGFIALPGAQTAHLVNLRDRPESWYESSEVLRKELRILRDLGLIRNSQPIAQLPAGFKLNDYLALTDAGERYLAAISPNA